MRILGVPVTENAPAAIDDLAVIVSAADPRIMGLSWSPPASGYSAITSYEMRHRTSDGSYGSWAEIAGSGPGTTAHTVPNLAIGTTHHFQVRAVASGKGAFPLVTAEATTTADPSAITDPEAEAGDGQVTLIWTTPSDSGFTITRYEVRQRTGNGAWNPWTEISGSDANTTSHSVSNLTNGTSYGFQVRVVNSLLRDNHIVKERRLPGARGQQ